MCHQLCEYMCNYIPEVKEMATNLAIDDKLIIEAKKLGHHKTKKDAVTEALKNYIKHKKQLRAINAFGKIQFDSEYDYKKQRKRT